ncbi:hypothetical protein PCL_05191 [Purpureocillium lilacinum]|uniref:Uncharacterized protein n=1 Tax=Purpureocillium lilacinum TaxID=33203 RepID=A0A2U3DVE8_PURLI|nr:hypothetical protein PCL_05191 [Purpureocillium lilacinum]
MKATFAILALACGLAAARQATTKEEILQLEKSNKEAHLCEFVRSIIVIIMGGQHKRRRPPGVDTDMANDD